MLFRQQMNNKDINEIKSLSHIQSHSDRLDQAFYCWAVQILNPAVKLKNIESSFKELQAHYQQAGRFFHKGLAHPRSLFSTRMQDLFLEYSDNLTTVDPQTVIDHLQKDIASVSRITEAQQILAAYYHDAIHRNDKITITLDSAPILLSMRDDKAAELSVEEKSAIIAERTLASLTIPSKHIIPILLAIFGTIPFSDESKADNLLKRLVKSTLLNQCEYTQSEVNAIIEMALSVSFADLASYAEDNLDNFNKKTWAMMLERYPKLADENHTLAEEALAIFKFYAADLTLLTRIETKHLNIYEIYEHSSENLQALRKSQNIKALAKIKEDIILQGVQLGSLCIIMTLLSPQRKMPTILTEDAVKNLLSGTDRFSQELPLSIIQVLKKHHQKCLVNNNLIHRGSVNGKITLKLVALFGLDSLMAIANTVTWTDGQLTWSSESVKKLWSSTMRLSSGAAD